MNLRIVRVKKLREYEKDYVEFGNLEFNPTLRPSQQNIMIKDGGCSNKYIDCYCVALDGSRFIGANAIYITDTEFENRKIGVGLIAGTFIIKEYGGMGIGTKLLNKAKNYLKKKVDIIPVYGGERQRRWLCKNGFTQIEYYIFKGKSGRFYIQKDGCVAMGKNKKVFNKVVGGSYLLLTRGRK